MWPTFRFQILDLVVLVTSLALLVPSARAVSEEGETHDFFLPQTITLQPKETIGPLASWASARPSVHAESDSIQFPVPSLAAQDQIGCFALTTVFDDLGDGGPVLEWISKGGDRTLLSAGLGDNGVALGLNARTVVRPQVMTLDGGVVRVSFPGRFSRLISTTLSPARELGVAVIGSHSRPALIQENEHILSEEEVSGLDEKPVKGDRTDGRIIHAELATLPIRIDLPDSGGITEFIVPLADTPQGSMLRAEVGGLDPESWIEVSINGESRGVLAIAPFELQDPGIVFSPTGHLLVAGWRSASLFLPARLWHVGENSLVMTLHRSGGDSGKAVHLRKVRCDLLFNPSLGATEATALPAAAAQPAATSGSPTAATTSRTATDTLSTGSLYGNPAPALFHATAPASLSPPLNLAIPSAEKGHK